MKKGSATVVLVVESLVANAIGEVMLKRNQAVSLLIILGSVSCASVSPYKEISDELPGEGIHVIQVGDKECIIAQNDEDYMDMECFTKSNLKHEVVIKRQ